ncbi:MAG: L-aspartate oxidase [Acidobacteria bacterium]|nr:L-aspartate oxidase [Acidobacteriota bacterium]
MNTDILVIGSGIAGLSAAIPLAEAYRVLVVTKGELFNCNTDKAQGGIAAAMREEDSPFLHFQDTMSAGDSLCREEALRHMVEQGPVCVNTLIAWGARFDREGSRLAFCREGAHRMNRILHAHGDATGHEIMSTLARKARSIENIRILEHVATVGLDVEGGTCRGAVSAHLGSGEVYRIRSRGTVLATGGAGRLYRRTTNSELATGDGFAMAYRVGAVIEDMEFVQFHPTSFHREGCTEFLLSEAMRGEGGLLRNLRGERFMPRFHPLAELAPRDVVSRSILREMEATGTDHVLLDMTHFKATFLRKRFPGLFARCLAQGIDFSREPIPVSPAAHYFMGGVKVDLGGCTSIRGLFACGETACTGVHGANRLASNSLLEGLVFGKHTGENLVANPGLLAPGDGGDPSPPDACPAGTVALGPDPGAEALKAEFRDLMWGRVGIIRTEEGLAAAEDRIRAMRAALGTPRSLAALETDRSLQAGLLVAVSARARKSSWGGHFRADHPGKAGSGNRHVNVVRAGTGDDPAITWTE